MQCNVSGEGDSERCQSSRQRRENHHRALRCIWRLSEFDTRADCKGGGGGRQQRWKQCLVPPLTLVPSADQKPSEGHAWGQDKVQNTTLILSELANGFVDPWIWV